MSAGGDIARRILRIRERPIKDGKWIHQDGRDAVKLAEAYLALEREVENLREKA